MKSYVCLMRNALLSATIALNLVGCRGCHPAASVRSGPIGAQSTLSAYSAGGGAQAIVLQNATVTAAGSVVVTNMPIGATKLTVNVSGTATGSMTFTITEVDSGDRATALGSPVSTSAITTTGATSASLTLASSGTVLVSWTATSSPSFTGVWASLTSTGLATTGGGSGSASTVSISSPVAAAGAVPTVAWAPVEVSQAPQSNCPDQGAFVGDAGATGSGSVLVDASITTTGVARRIWVGTAGTVCLTHLNDTSASTCTCYLNVAAGTYLDGVFTAICGADAGTTAGSFVLER
jgi:hypothetical protein